MISTQRSSPQTGTEVGQVKLRVHRRRLDAQHFSASWNYDGEHKISVAAWTDVTWALMRFNVCTQTMKSALNRFWGKLAQKTGAIHHHHHQSGSLPRVTEVHCINPLMSCCIRVKKKKLNPNSHHGNLLNFRKCKIWKKKKALLNILPIWIYFNAK